MQHSVLFEHLSSEFSETTDNDKFDSATIQTKLLSTIVAVR